MVTPACFRVLSIGTPKFKGLPLRLSWCVLVWNGKHWQGERHLPKEVFDTAEKEQGLERAGFRIPYTPIQLSDSINPHAANGAQTKNFKCAEEDQVAINDIQAMYVAIRVDYGTNWA
jgi:hypothetical protein